MGSREATIVPNAKSKTTSAMGRPIVSACAKSFWLALLISFEITGSPVISMPLFLPRIVRILFTNDGEMAKKLTHPSANIYKIYHVELDKPVTREDMKQMLDGIELEDGEIKVDDVQYASPSGDKRVVGVKLHSGRNRIVRRIFESLGYDVHKLDRVVFAGLTKKDLPRGRYRELTPQEVNYLKMV